MFSFKKKAVSFVVSALVASVALTGCGEKSDSGSTDNTKAGSSPSTASASYTVKHAMGETTIPATPKKVVILTNEGTEALLALGVKPVGAVKSWTGNPWYDHIKADMDGVKVLGDEGQPNLEEIAALKPDLIIGNKLRHEKIYEQLSKIAPTVESETLRGEWKNNFMLYAQALNKKADGEKVIADFDKRIEDLKAKAGDKLKQKISIVRFMPDRVRIYYKDTFTGIIFSQLGIARPDSQNKQEFSADVTKERIPEMDGDYMFYFTYEVGDGKANKAEQEWTNDALWKNLNVVKAGKVKKVDDAIWNTAGGVRAANLLLDDLYKFYGVSK